MSERKQPTPRTNRPSVKGETGPTKRVSKKIEKPDTKATAKSSASSTERSQRARKSQAFTVKDSARQNASTQKTKTSASKNSEKQKSAQNATRSTRNAGKAYTAHRSVGSTKRTAHESLGNQATSRNNAIGVERTKASTQASSQAGRSKSAKTNTPSFGVKRLQDGLWTPKGANSEKNSSANSVMAAVQDKVIQPKPIIIAIIAIVLVVACALGIDGLLTSNRIYQGVHIGIVDVSGMTETEAVEAVTAVYGPRFEDNSAVFFANEEAQKNPISQEEELSQSNLEEQMSYEEAANARSQWTVTPSDVDAVFTPSEFVAVAMAVGREDGSFWGRLNAQISGVNIEPVCELNQDSVDSLAETMTNAVGSMREESGVTMEDATAVAFEGHDGNEITPDWVATRLNEAFFANQIQTGYLLEPEFLPMRISLSQAESCANAINNGIASGMIFVYQDNEFDVSKDELASWITTDIVEQGFGWSLVPKLSESKAKSAILQANHNELNESNLEVQFVYDNSGNLMVVSNASGDIPNAQAAIDKTDAQLFTGGMRNEPYKVEVGSIEIPEELSFGEALDIGIITEISSFTTQYASGNTARVHNIHTAADLLNDSICYADGGTWSFNDTAGEATEDKGYMGAGAIVDGEYSDAIGGGICQVATTVYNAVYEAGYPIVKRYNHSLYISSYPEGRDAAIAYPDLDLVWSNNTTSDVLLAMSYTDTSVTAKLYGVDPHYEVSTVYGDWQKGEPFKTVYRNDSTLAAGTERVETSGTNGSQITIERIVKDSDGNVVDRASFTSVYRPKDKVILRGTK